MSENLMPKSGIPYSIDQGFAKWRPSISRLLLIPHSGGLCDVVFSQDGVDVACFTLTQDQRKEFAARLLAPYQADATQAATESVAGGVA